MSKCQIGWLTGFLTVLTLLLHGGSWLTSHQASRQAVALAQTSPSEFISVSALAFEPISQMAIYYKDAHQQLLSLGNQPRNLPGDSNRFVAPLSLGNQTLLRGLTVFGQDFDSQGEIRLRLKRCDHNQPRCVLLAESASTVEYDGGLFEKVSLFNERVDNAFYNYFLELELTALGNSGLRAVRLEMASSETAPPVNLEPWLLSGESTSFRLPNQTTTQARICTDDLGHLDNPTHYPILVVDGQVINLSSNSCVVVWGYSIELRRDYNTGPSSGSYQFLR